MKSRICLSHRLDLSGNRYGKLTAINDKKNQKEVSI